MKRWQAIISASLAIRSCPSHIFSQEEWKVEFSACHCVVIFYNSLFRLTPLSNFTVLSTLVLRRPVLWARRRRPNGKKCQRKGFRKNIRNWEMLGKTDLIYSGICLSRQDHPQKIFVQIYFVNCSYAYYTF